MSFGLDNRSRAVTEAIASAVEEDRIIFAAASNSGGNSGRAYPASLPGVMCVHATDGYGNQALFNPSKEKGDDNFATLGVAIESRWENKTVIKSGTSFATPVAAGIAANVLQFAKNHELVKYERLCCFRGMRRMFKYMSSERGDYEYVSPWKVFRPQDDGQMQSHTKKICNNIRTLLSTDKIPEM
jgi:subtilisin family serine protease